MFFWFWQSHWSIWVQFINYHRLSYSNLSFFLIFTIFWPRCQRNSLCFPLFNSESHPLKRFGEDCGCRGNCTTGRTGELASLHELWEWHGARFHKWYPRIIHLEIGFSIIKFIQFGGFPLYFWKHPHNDKLEATKSFLSDQAAILFLLSMFESSFPWHDNMAWLDLSLNRDPEEPMVQHSVTQRMPIATCTWERGFSLFCERSREVGIHKSQIQNHYTGTEYIFLWSSKNVDIFKHPPRPSFYPRVLIQNVMPSICHRHQGLLTILQCRFVGGANDETTTPKSQGHNLTFYLVSYPVWRCNYLNTWRQKFWADMTGLSEERICSLLSIVRILFSCEEHLLFVYFMWQMIWLLKDLSNFLWKATARISKELHPRTLHRISP